MSLENSRMRILCPTLQGCLMRDLIPVDQPAWEVRLSLGAWHILDGSGLILSWTSG